MSYRWRLKCDVHGWVYAWSNTPITQCPIESSDTVDTNMTYRVEEEKQVIQRVPTETAIKTKEKARIAEFFYNSDLYGYIHRLDVLSYAQSGSTTYDIELYDATNDVSLATASFSNQTDGQLNSVGNVATPPSGNVILEIYIWSAKKKYVYINDFIVYSRSTESL